MTDTTGSLAIFAHALDLPQLTITRSDKASRWRGPIQPVTTVTIHPARPHRVARLQVLRHVIDSAEDGRYAIRVNAKDRTGLIGPYAHALPTSLDLARCISTWPYPIILTRLFLRLDGKRVDALVAARYPGARNDPLLDPPTRTSALLANALRGAAPGTSALDALREAITLHRALIARFSRRRRRLLALLDPGLVPPVTAPGDDPAAMLRMRVDDQDLSATQAMQARDASPSGEPVPSPKGAATDTGAPEAHDAPTAPTLAEPEDERTTVLKRVRVLPAAPVQASRATRHDEWDYAARAYRRLWVTVREQHLGGRDFSWLDGLRARFPALSRRIGRGFLRMRPDAPRRERRLPHGDVIDIDSAIDAFVERRAGATAMDERTYQARPKRERDVVIALLLDMSGSTGHRVPERIPEKSVSLVDPDEDEPLWQTRRAPRGKPDAPARRVIDVARDAVGLLCEAMHAMGDRHAVFAFSGQGRDHVEFAVVKPFQVAWSPQSAASLAAVQPRGYTRTGAAVRHAMDHLRAERARRKILIVLSDGYPQDDDYGPREDTLEYALQDTAHALREAERAGVSTFNISIDSGDTDYLKRMCPRNRYWAVDEVEALPAKMQTLYRLVAQVSHG